MAWSNAAFSASDRMEPNVEIFSPHGKACGRELLDCGAASFSPPLWVMDQALHKRRVGQNLRLAREALGLSQQQMADRFCLGDKSKLSHWERGKNYPDPHFVYRLWKEEGITADWIYLGDKSRVPFEVAESLRTAEGELRLSGDAAESSRAAEGASPEVPKGAGRKGGGRKHKA